MGHVQAATWATASAVRRYVKLGTLAANGAAVPPLPALTTAVKGVLKATNGMVRLFFGMSKRGYMSALRKIVKE